MLYSLFSLSGYGHVPITSSFWTLDQLNSTKYKSLIYGFPKETNMQNLFSYYEEKTHKDWTHIFHVDLYRNIIRRNGVTKGALLEFWKTCVNSLDAAKYVDSSHAAPSLEDVVSAYIIYR